MSSNKKKCDYNKDFKHIKKCDNVQITFLYLCALKIFLIKLTLEISIIYDDRNVPWSYLESIVLRQFFFFPRETPIKSDISEIGPLFKKKKKKKVLLKLTKNPYRNKFMTIKIIYF